MNYRRSTSALYSPTSAKKALVSSYKGRHKISKFPERGRRVQILPINIIELFIQSNRDSCFHHITTIELYIVNFFYTIYSYVVLLTTGTLDTLRKIPIEAYCASIGRFYYYRLRQCSKFTYH